MRWSGLKLKELSRKFSDHYPIYLENPEKRWGPKPFKFINTWLDHPQFKTFLLNKWESYEISGCAGFVPKEKLKLLKAELKTWNRKVFGHPESTIDEKTKEIGALG